jgi:hypothetical protein
LSRSIQYFAPKLGLNSRRREYAQSLRWCRHGRPRVRGRRAELCSAAWNQLINAVASYASGDELERISVRDFQRYDDSGVNWR